MELVLRRRVRIRRSAGEAWAHLGNRLEIVGAGEERLFLRPGFGELPDAGMEVDVVDPQDHVVGRAVIGAYRPPVLVRWTLLDPPSDAPVAGSWRLREVASGRPGSPPTSVVELTHRTRLRSPAGALAALARLRPVRRQLGRVLVDARRDIEGAGRVMRAVAGPDRRTLPVGPGHAGRGDAAPADRDQPPANRGERIAFRVGRGVHELLLQSEFGSPRDAPEAQAARRALERLGPIGAAESPALVVASPTAARAVHAELRRLLDERARGGSSALAEEIELTLAVIAPLLRGGTDE